MKVKRSKKEIQEWATKRAMEDKEKLWKLIISKGRRFETEDSSGYWFKGKQYFDWIRGPTITGPDFPYKDEPIVKSPNPWRQVYEKSKASGKVKT